MLKEVKYWLREHPPLFDRSLRLRRAFGFRSAAYDLLDDFSRIIGRPLTFIQLGASDGLHSDPIREFIIRDHWSGVLVEPIPYSYSRLKENYRYLQRTNLAFVNAAVVASGVPLPGPFYTFDQQFLAGLPVSERLHYLQISSFIASHTRGGFAPGSAAREAIVAIDIPACTLEDLVRDHFDAPQIDLLVTDLEGYEAQLLPALNFTHIQPRAIFYESHNLGQAEGKVRDYLTANGYECFAFGGDSFAIAENMITQWRSESRWVEDNLPR